MQPRRYEDQVALSRSHDIHVQGSPNIMEKEGLPGPVITMVSMKGEGRQK